MNQIFMDVKEVSEKLGVSRSKAYNTIREWNDELKSMGFFTKSGSVTRAFFEKKCYGYEGQE